MAIICACLPMMWTPLTMLFPRLFPSSHRGTDTNGSSSVRGSRRNTISRSRNNWNPLHADHDVVSSISLDPIRDSPARTPEDSTEDILPHSRGEEAVDSYVKGIMKFTE